MDETRQPTGTVLDRMASVRLSALARVDPARLKISTSTTKLPGKENSPSVCCCLRWFNFES